MPNRHEFLRKKRASEGLLRRVFGIPNTTDPPYFGRFTGCLIHRSYRCSTIRMGRKAPGWCRKIDENILVDRRAGGRFAIYRKETGEGCCRDSPARVPRFQDTPTDPLPAIAFLTRPCAEVLLVPLGGSDTASIRAARPPGHAPTLLGWAQHRSLNGRKVQLLSEYRCARRRLSTNSDHA